MVFRNFYPKKIILLNYKYVIRFSNNLNTAIIASNNYVPQSLKPEIQGGDTCRKIIPTKFKDEKLNANTSGKSTDFNMKKIVNRRERPYIKEETSGEWRTGTRTWCWFGPFRYKCNKKFDYYHWYRPYYVPNNPRYFVNRRCKKRQ